MKSKIVYVRILVLLIAAITAIFFHPPYADVTVKTVSDAVTAPDPHSLTREQQQQGINALQNVID